ncbi:hypothetical protein FHL15_008485 [Xylaria flabelliformis]|uniref:Uncharacterized protein n=1 Tax=Xylaria flabelliformis TaxID=2512241 RepID=A0A553HRX7_9PEZI|nr:hypothetical protein FHL15_008485 [Xylaria flabelliformis]
MVVEARILEVSIDLKDAVGVYATDAGRLTALLEKPNGEAKTVPATMTGARPIANSERYAANRFATWARAATRAGGEGKDPACNFLWRWRRRLFRLFVGVGAS